MYNPLYHLISEPEHAFMDVGGNKERTVCHIRIQLAESDKENNAAVTKKRLQPPKTSTRRGSRRLKPKESNIKVEQNVSELKGRKAGKNMTCCYCSKVFRGINLLNRHVGICESLKTENNTIGDGVLTGSDNVMGAERTSTAIGISSSITESTDGMLNVGIGAVDHNVEKASVEDDDFGVMMSSEDVCIGQETGDGNFVCHICGKCFKRKRARNDHVDRHSDERKHQCAKCEKSFKTRGCLYKHMEVHGVMKAFNCDQCGRSFKSKGALRRHTASCGKEVPSDKLYKCNQCDSVFLSKNNLASHKRNVHVNFVQCPVCGKYFKAEHRLKVHMVTMHGEQGKFSCNICGKQFIFKSDCLRHEEIHNSENLYLCTHCGKSFKTKDYLSGHIQMHKNLSFPCSQCGKNFKTKKMLRSHMVVHSVVRNYHCTVCGKSFKSSMVLSRHKEVHLNIKRYQCQLCGKAYNNSGSLVHHKKTHTVPESIVFSTTRDPGFPQLGQQLP